ncbi:MAG TPA: 50S ribosomal protein L29 [Gaiellaceae bacterium]|nr:50S ribosomal protein L29 [Gaiellaceae bacterium]
MSLRASELREMSDDQLDDALAERRQELFNLRFQSATGALDNAARLKLAKREIARILTVRNERELAKETT